MDDRSPLTLDEGLRRAVGELAAEVHTSAPAGRVLLVGGDDWVHAHLAAFWGVVTRVDAASAQSAALPFDDDAFEVVVALHVLERAADPEAVLGELQRVSHGHVVTAGARKRLARVASLVRGRHVATGGRDPSHRHQWTTPGFLRLASRFGGVRASRLPLGWTAVWITRN